MTRKIRSIIGLGILLLGSAVISGNALADGDDWGGPALSLSIGVPGVAYYGAPTYYAPPPPVYYAPPPPPPGWYYRHGPRWHRGYRGDDRRWGDDD